MSILPDASADQLELPTSCGAVREGNICPVARSLNIIGDRWSLLIIRDAIGGLHHFGEFQRNPGMAKNILSTRLKRMVEHGIMTVEPASDDRYS